MIPHLPKCIRHLDPSRYVCNCGADAQNATATKLDQAESTRKADAIDRRWGVDPESERRLDAMLRETRPAAPPRHAGRDARQPWHAHSWRCRFTISYTHNC